MTHEPQTHSGVLNECLDELDEIFLGSLTRFPPTVVAMGLRLHLEALMLLLLQRRISTRQEVRQFLQELEHNVLPGLD